MTITESVRGSQTSLEVFPITPASFAHPVDTQKYVFDIPDHVPYSELVRLARTKKIIPFCTLKKTLLYKL